MLRFRKVTPRNLKIEKVLDLAANFRTYFLINLTQSQINFEEKKFVSKMIYHKKKKRDGAFLSPPFV